MRRSPGLNEIQMAGNKSIVRNHLLRPLYLLNQQLTRLISVSQIVWEVMAGVALNEVFHSK